MIINPIPGALGPPEVEGEADEMSRMKILLMGLLAVFAVSSVASTTASAQLQGPWWMKLEGGKQVKIEQNKAMQVKSTRTGGFPFKILAAGLENTIISCTNVDAKGWVWNGPSQGQGKETITFGGCIDKFGGCKNERVAELSQAKVASELMWKYRGQKKELGEQGNQEIYDVFAPRSPIEEYEPGNFRSLFLTVRVEAGGTCPEEKIPLYAEGTKTTWEDQLLQKGEHEKIPVIWGTAAHVEPENLDQRAPILEWSHANTKKLHHKEVEVQAILQLATANAKMEGTLGLQEEFGKLEFGAWSHT